MSLKQLQDSINTIFGFRRAPTAGGLSDERRLDRNALAKAGRLAAKHHVTIERDGNAGYTRHDTPTYWVTYEPLLDTDADPLQGGHFCTGGREVLQAVAAYVEHLTDKSD